MVFYGADIWLDLYPDIFDRKEGTNAWYLPVIFFPFFFSFFFLLFVFSAYFSSPFYAETSHLFHSFPLATYRAAPADEIYSRSLTRLIAMSRGISRRSCKRKIGKSLYCITWVWITSPIKGARQGERIFHWQPTHDSPT